jgi:hypothetical protein
LLAAQTRAETPTAKAIKTRVAVAAAVAPVPRAASRRVQAPPWPKVIKVSLRGLLSLLEQDQCDTAALA